MLPGTSDGSRSGVQLSRVHGAVWAKGSNAVGRTINSLDIVMGRQEMNLTGAHSVP